MIAPILSVLFGMDSMGSYGDGVVLNILVESNNDNTRASLAR